MKVLTDFEGLVVRLTDERLAHILEHPEMVGMEHAIGETLARPERVVQSTSEADAFVVTAYLTDTIKRGTTLRPKNK